MRENELKTDTIFKPSSQQTQLSNFCDDFHDFPEWVLEVSDSERAAKLQAHHSESDFVQCTSETRYFGRALGFLWPLKLSKW